MSERKLSPVLKWAGGKTQLLEPIRARMPEDYGTYFEPFLGGGAVVLGLRPARAVLSDNNEQLVNLYVQLRRAPDRIIEIVSELDGRPCGRELYQLVRERYNRKISARELDEECAALLIWLNKHCFNGLYRVNGKGLFNVPYNNRAGGRSIDPDNIAAIGAYLQGADVTVVCADFEQACAAVRAGDFVYFDSPYVPVSGTANFTDYTKDGFRQADHERLAALFARLDRAGARVMLSNNDVPLVHELYRGYDIRPLDVKRMINRDAAKRTGREVLITNY